MDTNDNKQLALLKAVSAHEQAAATLNDLLDGLGQEAYAGLLARIEENITELRRLAADAGPGERV